MCWSSKTVRWQTEVRTSQSEVLSKNSDSGTRTPGAFPDEPPPSRTAKTARRESCPEGLERHDSESWSLLSSERYGLPEEQALWAVLGTPYFLFKDLRI